MPDEWMIRVDGKEFGPVDVETLLEWKREGRLLESNEARREDDAFWGIARSIPGVFPPALPAPAKPSIFQRRSFAEIILDSVRFYRRGFATYLCLALLVAVPSIALQFIPAAMDLNGQPLPNSTRNAGLALAAIVALIVSWPIFLAGVQIATADLAHGLEISIREVLRRAINYWPRFVRLCLVVYGSYFFWTAIPVVIIYSIVAGQPTLISIFLALAAAAIQVFMVARLWVNFLFWQQSATIGKHEVLDALRESRTLARSQTRPKITDRPIWRGAMLASLWFLVVVALGSVVQLPVALDQVQSAMNTGDMEALMKSVTAAHNPNALMLALMIFTAVIHTLLRPIFGIAFVLLYLDAKSDAQVEPDPRAGS